jgi:membrane protease YdiL (CAAX protease family)
VASSTRGKIVIGAFSVGCIVLAGIVVSVVLNRGASFHAALLLAGVFLVFCFIPIVATLRSIKRGDEEPFGLWLKKRGLARSLTLFVISPLLVGLIVFLTYPSTGLSVVLSLTVIIAASVYYFLTG